MDVLPEIEQGNIFIVPIRLEKCDIPEQLSLFHCIDYYENGGWDRLISVLQKGMDRLGLIKPLRLRSEPKDRFSEEDAEAMLRECDFYDSFMNRSSKGLPNQYELIVRDGQKLVIDHTTGLRWQQSGSPDKMTFEKTFNYIEKINKEKYGGYDNWRLPTLEEAMSLMEPNYNGEISLYIDSVFDANQWWVWTSDKTTTGHVWIVDFSLGRCLNVSANYYVRAVCS